MKLRDKNCFLDLFAYNNHTGEAYEVSPKLSLLSPAQAAKVATRPWLIIQYVHFVADLFTWDGHRPEIYAYVSFPPSRNYEPGKS
jgi:hypothetical protein